jgi:peptide/nickel transport system substrate-binding protein
VGRDVVGWVVAIVLLASWGMPFGAEAAVDPPSPQGTFVDSILWSVRSPSDALDDMANGSLDLYTSASFSADELAMARTDPNLRTVEAYGQVNDLFVNPVPVANTSLLNPFAIREVRNALNHLIDRDYINSEIYAGYGLPQVTPWPLESPETARDPFFYADVMAANWYDPARAEEMISQALLDAGATFDDVWTWQGNPIVVKLIQRLEDERFDIAAYVGAQLESVGLTVDLTPMLGSQAIPLVYGGDPTTGEWTLYTEGWAYSWPLAWPDDLIGIFHTDLGFEPIWEFYDASPELTDVASQLLNQEYADVEERRSLMERAVPLALDESVRVWLISGATFVHADRVTALVTDSEAGLLNAWPARTARFDSPGGTLRIGQVIQVVSPFQPWRGFGFATDRSIGATFNDPGLAIHPHTGEYLPVRSEFEVETAGRTDSLEVPADAIVYNPTSLAWESVAPGTRSRSRVTLHYTFGEWHHGVPVTMNDVLYHVSLIARRQAGDIAALDPRALGPEDAVVASQFRGLRVVDGDTLEIWTDAWHVDPSFIAAAADVWPKTPWEVGELAMATTLHDNTRVDEFTARNQGRTPIDLASGATLGFMDREISDGNVTTAGAGVTRPPGFSSLIGQAEAEERWAAIQSWRTTEGHFYPSNGPFALDSIDLGSREVLLSAFAAYPFPADRWDYILGPPVPTLTIDSIPPVVRGEAVQINLTTELDGIPYDDATVRYRIVFSETGLIVLEGQPSFQGAGRWSIDLNASFTAGLEPGVYVVEGAAVGNQASRTVFAFQFFRATDDAVAPTSTIDPKPEPWLRQGSVVLAVTATDDTNPVIAVFLVVAYSQDGTGWTDPELVDIDDTSPFSFTYPPDRGEGWYRFWTLATDSELNTESLDSKPATGDAQIGFDSVGPESSLASSAPHWNAETPIALTVTGEDATSGVRRVDLYTSHSDDGVAWSPPALTATDDAPPFTFSFLPTEGDGRYRLWSVATDVAGNTEAMTPADAELEFGFDEVPPVTTLAPLSSYWQAAPAIALSVSVEGAGGDISRVRLFESFSADGSDWSTPGEVAVDSAAPFGFSYTPSRGDGRYRLWTLATDVAGNEESLDAKPVEGDIEFGRDTVAPRVASSAPTDGASAVATSGAQIRIVFSEGVDHEKAETAFSITPSVTGTFSWEGNTLIFTPTGDLASGTTYTVRIGTTASDPAGNSLAAEYTATFSTEPTSLLPRFFGELPGIALLVVIIAAIAGVAIWKVRKKR